MFNHNIYWVTTLNDVFIVEQHTLESITNAIDYIDRETVNYLHDDELTALKQCNELNIKKQHNEGDEENENNRTYYDPNNNYINMGINSN